MRIGLDEIELEIELDYHWTSITLLGNSSCTKTAKLVFISSILLFDVNCDDIRDWFNA